MYHLPPLVESPSYSFSYMFQSQFHNKNVKLVIKMHIKRITGCYDGACNSFGYVFPLHLVTNFNYNFIRQMSN